MIVEIRKAGFLNKGAELMLLSAIDKLKKDIPSCQIAASCDHTKSLVKLKQHKILIISEYHKKGIDLALPFNVIPSRLLNKKGVVKRSQIDAVLDASGLAYSDSWGPAAAQHLAKLSEKLAIVGTPLVLLPQAFGPFENENLKRSMQTIVKNSKIVFARDEISYEMLLSIIPDAENIKIAPDFTNIYTSTEKVDLSHICKPIGIIPNQRMIDKVTDQKGNLYLEFLEESISVIERSAHSPFFLIQDPRGDLEIANMVNQRLSKPIPIVVARDADHTKAVISECKGLVASRYHSIICGLSQGKPVIGTGWHHKYQSLYKDYNCPDMLVNLTEYDSREHIRMRIDCMFTWLRGSQEENRMNKTLIDKGTVLKRNTNAMWELVIQAISKG